ADPAQCHLVELAPGAAFGLDERGGLLVGNCHPPADVAAAAKRLEQLIFLHRAGGRIDLTGLLRLRRNGGEREQRKHCPHDGKAEKREPRGHGTSSSGYFLVSC